MIDYQEEFNNFINIQKPTKKNCKYIDWLDSILYTVSEKIGYPDYVDTVSVEQAIFLWKIIETLKTKKPSEKLEI